MSDDPGGRARWTSRTASARRRSTRARSSSRSRAPTLELDEELLTINLGPHHPATHGVLRLLCQLEGEDVRDVQPIIGYVHTGIEKSCEDQEYWKAITFVERMDYLAYYANSMAYCIGGRGAAGRGGAAARPVAAGDPPGAEPDRQPPVLARPPARSTSARSRCSGGACASATSSSTCSRCPRASASTRATSRSAASSRTSRPGGRTKCREFLKEMPTRIDQYEALLDQNEIWLQRTKNTGIVSREKLLELGVTGPLLRAAGEPWDLRKAMPYSRLRELRLQDPGGQRGRQLRPLPLPPGRDARVAEDRGAGARRPARRGRTSPPTARSRCRRATSWPPRWRR